jgi:Flp pilus assembly protein TadG
VDRRPGSRTSRRSRTARRGIIPWRRDDGASAVEFAIILPVLVVVVFGIIDFGVIFAQQLALNNGVRQGVRLAVVAGNPANQTCAQVVSGVQSASGPTIGMDPTNVAVQVQRVQSTNTSSVSMNCFSPSFSSTGSGGNAATRVCVDATHTDSSIKAVANYDTKFLVPLPFFSSPTFTLTATTVYRCEFSS